MIPPWCLASGFTPDLPLDPRVPVPDEQRLLYKLLYNYDTASRPVYNASHRVTVKFGITLIQIFDMVSTGSDANGGGCVQFRARPLACEAAITVTWLVSISLVFMSLSLYLSVFLYYRSLSPASMSPAATPDVSQCVSPRLLRKRL